MGLDMYLNRKTYVKNWGHTKPELETKITITKGGKKMKGVDVSKVCYVEEEVAYWRKANAIHAWFVSNVQDGVDDCRDYEVGYDKIKELLNVCEEVLAGSKLIDGKVSTGYTYENGKQKHEYEDGKVIEDTSVAEELLPTQGGFFFGSTDYNQHYIEDVTYTRDVCKKLLKDRDDGAEGYLVYHSSW